MEKMELRTERLPNTGRVVERPPGVGREIHRHENLREPRERLVPCVLFLDNLFKN